MTEEKNQPGSHAWFKRPLNVLWLVLAIASLGIFAPSFLAFKKHLKAAKWITTLTLLGLFVSGYFENAYVLIGVWLVALLLSIFLNSTVEKKFKQPNVKSKAKAKAKADAKAKVIEKFGPREDKKERNAPLTILTFGQWFHYKIKIAPQVRKLIGSLKNELIYHENLVETRDRFKDLILSINLDALGSTAEGTIFETSGCGLIEVRKGARVTHRESSYSGSSSGGSVRVGRVRVGGGSSSGSSSSTSISYPAPDELTMIDDGGRFFITNLKVSYSGSMFTKTTDFKKIVDFQYNGRQLLIAPRTGSKVWIIQFELLEELWIAATLVGVAHDMDEKRLDVKAVTVYGDAATAVKFAFERKLFEIQIAYEASVNEIKSFRQRHAEFIETFPTMVKKLDF